MYKDLILNNYIKKLLVNKFLVLNEEDFFKKKIDFYFNNLKDFDKYSCYLEIFPNAGGIETHQLVKIFTEFYLKWLKKNFFNVNIIYKELCEYGYKKTIIYIEDIFSFFLIKNESGIHRIIRKNPLINNNKIQTSYLNIKIFPDLTNIINKIDKKDIIIETFKSKGSGGQHVNNTNSAVRITHILSKIVVNSQSERSQHQNKINALKILNYKLMIKKKENFKSIFKFFDKNKKYIKTYYFDNNIIIDHINKTKINLIDFFKLNFNFLSI